MTDVLKRLGRTKLRRLKCGDSVAWSKSNWDTPENRDFAYDEGQIMAHPSRTSQYVTVEFQGRPREVAKNQLYRIKPVVDVEDMHTRYDYNS